MGSGRTARAVAVSAVISVALYLSGILVMLTPLPLVYVTTERSRRGGVVATAIALAVVATFSAVAISSPGMLGGALAVPASSLANFFPTPFLWFASVGYFGFFAAVALALGEGALRCWGVVKWGGLALGLGLAVLALIALAGGMVGPAAGGGLKGYLIEIVGQIAAAGEASGNADLSLLAGNRDEIVAFMMGIAPSIVFVFVLFTVVLNMLLARRFIRGRHAFAHIHNAARFRLPDLCVWAIVAGGIAYFADAHFLRVGVLKVAALNVLIAFGALYFLQGLAVVVYFLQGVRTPLLKVATYVMLVLFFQKIGMLIVAIGVADVWIDFRLRHWRARHVSRG